MNSEIVALVILLILCISILLMSQPTRVVLSSLLSILLTSLVFYSHAPFLSLLSYHFYNSQLLFHTFSRLSFLYHLDALDLGLVSQESFGLTVANCLPSTKSKSKYVPGKITVKITETQLLPWKEGLNALYKFISGNSFLAICHREVFIQVRF